MTETPKFCPYCCCAAGTLTMPILVSGQRASRDADGAIRLGIDLIDLLFELQVEAIERLGRSAFGGGRRHSAKRDQRWSRSLARRGIGCAPTRWRWRADGDGRKQVQRHVMCGGGGDQSELLGADGKYPAHLASSGVSLAAEPITKNFSVPAPARLTVS